MTLLKTRRASPLHAVVDGVCVAVVALLGLVTFATALNPPRNGPLAIALIFLPYLFLPLLALALPALWPGGRVAKAAVGAGLLLWAGLVVPGLVPRFGNPVQDAPRLTVASWNTLQDNRDAAAIRRAVLGSDAMVVALQELSPEQRDLLLADPAVTARFRYRALYPNDRYLGMGLLSVFPILEEGNREMPPLVWARLDVAGRRVLIVNAHPLPGRIAWLHVGAQALPVAFDSLTRDDQIATVLGLVETLRRPGEAVLLVGDFNVTDREPAYRAIVARFADAKRAAGWGAQNTWKSWFLVHTDWAFLRIDYLFHGAEFETAAFSTDCRPSGSDHCLLRGEFRFRGSEAP